MRRQDSAMHALRVNTARVQTPLTIKMVSSPDVFPQFIYCFMLVGILGVIAKTAPPAGPIHGKNSPKAQVTHITT
jgi:hypothetical protein